MEKIKHYYPLVVALAILIGLTVYQFYSVLTVNGAISYPLDDTFIHLSISKNLAEHGIWGPTQFQFSSASSSFLYTVVLAAVIKVTTASTLLPFLINLLFAIITVAFIFFIVDKNYLKRYDLLLILVTIILFTPLNTLTLIGMEHTLHCLANLTMSYYAAVVLERKHATGRDKIFLTTLAALSIGARYESLFIVGLIALFLFIQKQRKFAVIFFIGSLLPIILFGIYSMVQGGFFFPNSVLVKGHKVYSFSDFVNYFFDNVSQAKALATLILFSLFTIAYIWLKEKKTNDRLLWLSILFVLGSFAHLEFAAVGWFFRYETYLSLMGLSIVALFISRYEDKPYFFVFRIILLFGFAGYFRYLGFKNFLTVEHFFFDNQVLLLALSCLIFALFYYGREKLLKIADYTHTGIFIKVIKVIAFAIFIYTMYVPSIQRASDAYYKYPMASKNIYEQQVQMAKFANTYYNGKKVVLNDIGAVCYYNDIHLIDLVGLGYTPIVRASIERKKFPDFWHNLVETEQPELIIIYDSWFKKLPNTWIKVGEWKIPENRVCGQDYVSFYGVNRDYAKVLLKNLKEFEPKLPKGVTVTYKQI